MAESPMTDERLAELLEAGGKATPGPWTWFARGMGGAEKDVEDILGYGIDGPDEPQLDRERFARRADAMLAASAPELLAEVERLRAEMASATGLGERMTLLWDKACGERDEARADRDRARGIAVALEQQLAAVKNTVEVRADTARMFARLSEKGHSDFPYLVNLGKAKVAAEIRDEVLRVLGEQDGGNRNV